MTTTPPVVDRWSALDHKAAMGPHAESIRHATWVPPHDRRRLTAYTILAAYLSNTAREWLYGASDDAKRKRREFGDAELLVSRVVGGVLGDSFRLAVDGADVDLPARPDLPDRPEPPEPGPDGTTDPLEARIHDVAEARWQAAADEIVDEWARQIAEQPDRAARQRWLAAWADLEFVAGKMHEAEHDAVGLGDAVYVVKLSDEAQRPTLEVVDPGFYFPVLDSVDAGGFPRRVHLADEVERVENGRVRRYVHRRTWELVPIVDGYVSRFADVFDENGGLILDPGDRIDRDTGEVSRVYPWADEPSTTTCLYSEGEWPLDGLDGNGLDDLDDGAAVWLSTDGGDVARRLDLRVDFLPLVHVPNTPASRDHFGESLLALCAQILDEIASTDTDVASAAELAAGPVIALVGAYLAAQSDTTAALGDGFVSPPAGIGQAPNPGYGSGRGAAPRTAKLAPGSVWQLPAGGRMDVLDTSPGLHELRDTAAALLERLSTTARVPGEVLGRVKVSEAPSGFAFLLGFGPYRQLVDELRLVREPKYRLLVKIVQRMAQAGGWLDDGPTLPAGVEFGSYLPADRSGLIADVAAALAAGAISHETAVAWLVAGGLDVPDARLEVERIRRSRPELGKDLADATGSEAAAAEYLGVVVPDGPGPDPLLDLGDPGAGA